MRPAGTEKKLDCEQIESNAFVLPGNQCHRLLRLLLHEKCSWTRPMNMHCAQSRNNSFDVSVSFQLLLLSLLFHIILLQIKRTPKCIECHSGNGNICALTAHVHQLVYMRFANGSVFIFLLSFRLSCKNRNRRGNNDQGARAIEQQFNLILYFCPAKKKLNNFPRLFSLVIRNRRCCECAYTVEWGGLVSCVNFKNVFVPYTSALAVQPDACALDHRSQYVCIWGPAVGYRYTHFVGFGRVRRHTVLLFH